MALTGEALEKTRKIAREQAKDYPLAAYNFRVTVDGATMRFAKVSGLQIEYRTLTYRDGMSFRDGEALVRYFVDTWTSITLEQGTVAKSAALLEWLHKNELATMQIHLCDADGQPAVVWQIKRAVPVKLAASAWDAKSGEVAIDSLEVKAAGISIAFK